MSSPAVRLIVLFFLAPAATAGGFPQVTPPIAVSLPDQFVARSASAAAFAAGDELGLLAWVELRAGHHLILANRIDRHGAPIAPRPIRIASTGAEPSVARVDDRYLVVWRGLGISARLVSDRGETVGDAFRVAHVISTIGPTKVVALGDRFLVLWADSNIDSLMGAIVSTEGAVIETRRLADLRIPLAVAPAADGGALLLSARQVSPTRRRPVLRGPRTSGSPPYTIEAAAISPEGELGEGAVLESDVPFWPDLAVAATGESYLAAWETVDGLRVREIDRFGRPLGAPAFLRSDSRIERVSIASNGSTSVIAWGSSALLWRDGAPEGERFSLESDTLAAGVAAGRLLLFTSDFQKPLRSRVVLGSQLGPPVDLALTAAGQSEPAVATSLSELLVVWVEEVALDRNRLLARRFSFGGVPLDADPVQISELAQFSPVDVQVVSSGDEYLVLWTGAYSLDRIVGRRISPAGVLLDPEPIVICRDCTRDGEISAVWMDDRYAMAARGGESRGPVVYTLERFPVREPENLFARDESNLDPVLAWSGRVLLASWVRVTPGPPCQTPRCYPFPILQIAAARIAVSGDRLEAEPMLLPGTASPIADGNLAAAGVGGMFAVVSKLESPSPGVRLPGFNFTRIDEADGRLTTQRIETSSLVMRPTLVWTGRTFLVAYEDSYGADIRGHTVLSSGVPLASFPISATAAEERNPAAAAGPFGVSFVAYEAVSTMPGSEYLGRIFFRRVVD